MWEEFRFVEVSYHFGLGDTVKSSKWKRISLDGLEAWKNEHRKAAALFRSVQTFKFPERTKDEPHWCDLFFDLDAEECEGHISEEAHQLCLDESRFIVDYFLRGFEVEPRVWFSGNRGYHIQVPGVVFGAEANSRLTYQWRHVLEYINTKLRLTRVDKSIYSLPRMWRIENTKHPKSGLFKRRLLLVEFRTLGYERIRELASEPGDVDEDKDATYELNEELQSLFVRGRADYEEKRKVVFEDTKTEYKFNETPPACVSFLLENGLAELGTKNKADMALAGFFKDSGIGVESALQIMVDWASKIPDALTHIHSPRSRAMQTTAVVRTVYGDPKYRFSCGSILACGMEIDCTKCPVKEIETKEVTLSTYSQAENLSTKISLDADVIGRGSQDLIVPIKIKGWCHFNPDSKACLACTMQNYFNQKALRNERTLIFNAKTPKTIELIDISAVNLAHRIKRLFGVRERCYDFKYDVEWGNTHIVYLASRITDFRIEEGVSRMKAFYLGHGLKLNQSYKLTGYVHTHPRTQAATFLIEEAKPLQSSLETFMLDDSELSELEIFQPSAGQSPLDKVKEIHKVFVDSFVYVFGRDELLLAVDAVYHSVRRFVFQKQNTKGWMDALIVGDTRQGKTDIVEKLMGYYNLGTLAGGETASRTGLLYNVQMVKGEEAWVQFGLLCRANGLLVAIDEIHGMAAADFREFTTVRSKGIVDVVRYAWGKAMAETRLISIANAKSGMSLDSYGYPVMAIPDIPCFRSREDISRFDFAVGVRAGDVTEDIINTNVNELDDVDNPYTSGLCKNLILWVWTRKPSDVIIDESTEKHILDASREFSMEYVPIIPLAEPADMRLKIARLSAAFAGRTYSTNDGVRLLVEDRHVDSAIEMLHQLYKAPGLDYWGYSDDMAKAVISEEGLFTISYDFKREFGIKAESIAQWLLRNNTFNKTLIKTALQLGPGQIDSLMAVLLTYRFIEPEQFRSGYRKTSSGREFFYRFMHDELYTGEEKDDEL